MRRVGKWPKRAFAFRTDEPIIKIKVAFDGGDPNKPERDCDKVELLADGQQCIDAGVHPDTHRPYEWFGGSPWEIARCELPYLSASEAQELVDAVVDLLVKNFGFKVRGRGKAKKRNGANEGAAPADWSLTPDVLLDHDKLVSRSMSFLRTGMGAGALVRFLRQQVETIIGVAPDRIKKRLKEIPGIVEWAAGKLAEENAPQPEPERPGDPNIAARLAA